MSPRIIKLANVKSRLLGVSFRIVGECHPCKRHEVFVQLIFDFSGRDMPTVKLFGRTPGTRYNLKR
mgnify:FL=1